jgi:hypothetical protein
VTRHGYFVAEARSLDELRRHLDPASLKRSDGLAVQRLAARVAAF